jgi:hypothetical protein
MTQKFASRRSRRLTGRGLWTIAGAALIALCVWVPLALAAPKQASAAPPVNTQAPRVLGVAQGGQVLRADPGQWQGKKPITFGFQWQVCDASGCANVQTMKATDRIYAVSPADVGKSVRVLVTASNRAGTASMPSQPTGPIAAAPATNPHNTALPQIFGSLREGQTLVAQPGSWSATNPPIRYSYQWRICRPDGGACETTNVATRTYTLKPSDLGHSFRVLVHAAANFGPVTPLRTSWALSDPTGAVGPLSAPVNTAAPTITGKAQSGELLTAHPGSWRGTQLSFTYQWLRCDQNGANCQTLNGATQSGFKLSDRDIGHRLRVLVTAGNRFGSTQVLSGSTATVRAKPVPGPANTQTPAISGTAVQGATLTADPGKWQGQGPITFSYQWLRCDQNGANCLNLNGATQSGFKLSDRDIGHRLRVQVTAHNPGGISVANSSPTAVVQVSAPPPPPPPSTKGTMSISQVALPDRLEVDRLQFTPSRITSHNQPLIARFHVSETQNGRSVQGAIVYAVGVPYNRLSNAPEAITGSDGWATITFRVQPTFQLQPGNLVVMFVRARKPGENLLAGVSNRRLVSVAIG